MLQYESIYFSKKINKGLQHFSQSLVKSSKHLKLKIMSEVFMAAVVFFAIYLIFKNFTDFLLRRKIIKAGHFEKAEILEQKISSASIENSEVNKYPSLKWGLVAFFAGAGLILIDYYSPGFHNHENNRQFMDSVLPFGIELVSISLGFIVYFIVVNFMSKK